MSELGQDTINTFVIAAHHDLPKVQEMLAENPDLLNESAEWFETPIQAAAHVGNREIADYLLDQGAWLDICTAAMMGMESDVAEMLEENPMLSGANGAHNIPVMFYPAISGSIPIAQRLLDAGADINAGEGGNTALHAAAGFGQLEMAQWLLDHGANPYANDFNGKLPIDLAEDKGYTAIADLLRPFMQT